MDVSHSLDLVVRPWRQRLESIRDSRYATPGIERWPSQHLFNTSLV